MKRVITCIVAFAAGAPCSLADTVYFDFASPVVTAETQTPGAWYRDRYSPAVFESSTFGPAADGYALRQGVRMADDEAHRTGGYTGQFYNYQGRKYDLGFAPDPIASASIDLYVDSGWNAGTRAGMWTTMANGNLTYPIIEYVVGADMGGSPFTGFRYWQSNVGWTATSLEDPGTEMWYNLDIRLSANWVQFFINGNLFGTVDNLGAESISNVILQAHNQGVAGEYDVYWDNFSATTAVVPLPSGAALAGLGLLGIGVGRRCRRC